MKIFVAYGNSDQTEGRGMMLVKGYSLDLEVAIDESRKWGVMGYGTGDVFEFDIPDDGSLLKASEGTKVWGYRKRWDGKWDYGYLDLRDAPSEDPEFGEYLRLKEKFEGEA